MTKNFVITEERLLALLQAEDTLQSLEGAGVDNWCGYDHAYESMDTDLQDATHIDPFWVLTGVEEA